MRDFTAELASVQCWDQRVQAVYQATGEPAIDCVLQTRGELEDICAFIEAHRVRRYLEIGLWTGQLWCTLHALFGFDLVAGCDDGYAKRRFGLPLHTPPDGRLFRGNSRSAEYLAWRQDLGLIDLVLIDGDHNLAGVQADIDRERRLPHRFLALHDITGSNRHTVGVRQAWHALCGGQKQELLAPHREIGLEHSTMGIGIWSETERIGPAR
ncbi:MAG: class I SAM-dependent methyltransferase [Oligoflexia bacterium]|nr:class I SAM-dependent methyltransferase [Oligoflexia bacterium]